MDHVACWRLWVFCLAMVAMSTNATGATEKFSSFFRVRGKVRALKIAPDVRIVKWQRELPSTPDPLSRESTIRLRSMGLTAVRLQDFRAFEGKPASMQVGLPVWFGKHDSSIGVLTDEILVRVTSTSGSQALLSSKAESVRPTPFQSGLFVARFKNPLSALKAANALGKRAGVAYAHPNFILPKDFRTLVEREAPGEEPLFSEQWHLDNRGQFGGTAGADVHALDAWRTTLGAPSVLIAVLDGGFELSHPDLQGAMFRNPNEIAGNGVDDDGNGYVDDLQGWNFWAGNNDVTIGVADEHGTSVAGLAGARINGRGMVGTCPNCRLLPVTMSWKVEDDAAAFLYATKLGAAVITNSWGYAVDAPTTDAVAEAIDTAARDGRQGKGAIVLFAMNNINQDDCVGPKPDISSLASVVAISGADDRDFKVEFSAWGDCMEFLAPTYGTNRRRVATTDLSGTRGYNNGRVPSDLQDLAWTNAFGGTSAATPIAAGVFGLLLAEAPLLKREEAIVLMAQAADKVHPDVAAYDPQTGFSRKYGFGRINAARAIALARALAGRR